MPTNPKLVRDHFLAAAELPVAERAAYLTTHCGGDAELQAAVQRLLAAHDQPADVLDRPAPGMPTAEFAPITERPGTMIGPYKLMEQIGEGGFGLVFVAEQTEPVRRKVALKVIKPGMDSKQVIARFEAERQALAMMDHPNIARVLDAGTTDTGRPYFVMELVRGISITNYCDQNQLTPRERLELFVNVCQAIQHAHQKGIIHRDIKPSNVLVTSHDGKPVAKVIDFGVAKAIHQHLTERTIYTNFAQIVGTPLYMSPEQAEMSTLDIDTRSDVYSLGVLLYELLTGSTPLEKQRFAQAAYDEIRRLIREEEPPRPSERLSTSGALPSLAASRKTEPARLSKLMRGELDWIVMKSLEKDRTRRYETANGLARDVERYLADEPVEACPPSATYRLKKILRRNKGPVLATALVLLALLAGMAGTTWGLIEARRQRDRAEAARQSEAERAEGERLAKTAARAAEEEALKAQRAATARAEGERLAKLDAEARQAEAERQKSRAETGEKLASERLVQVAAEKMKAEEEKKIALSVRDFLQNKLLGQADPRTQANALLRSGGLAAEAKQNPTIRELLDRAAQELAAERIDANFPNQPLLQAEILQTVGRTFRGVGEYERAMGFLERSEALYRQHLGPDHLNTLFAMNDLAMAYRAAGKPDLALPLFEETLKLTNARLGPNHPDTLMSMNNLATAYLGAGKPDLALPLFEETLKLRKANSGPDHPDTLQIMNNLATAHAAAGKLELAIPLYEEALKLMKAKLGPDHPVTLQIMNNLATAYLGAGKLDLALPLFEEALKLRKAKLGPDHPDTLQSMNNLALAYKAAGKLDLAMPLFEETLKLRKAKLGLDHPDTLMSMNNLATAYLAAWKLDLALPLLFEEGHRAATKHQSLRWVSIELFDGYARAGKTEQAAALAKELVVEVRKQLPKESPQLAAVLARIARLLLQANAFTEAEPLLRE
ncbi:MAG: serine/threonine-protein kinase, partial [Thermoguttaceae bacterium]